MRTRVLVLLMLLSLPMVAQKFYNLTVSDIEIGQRVPRLAYTFALSDNYADSLYTARIAYPEFIPMTSVDQQRYDSLSASPLPSEIEIETRIVSDRKHASLEVEINPFALIDGKASILTSFMLAIEAQPKALAKASSPQKVESTNIYTDESVLKEGTWAKIRIPETGLYQLSDQYLRNLGFSNPAKVKIYGYGGNLQNETLRATELAATDDLKEVPTCTVDGQRLFYGLGTVYWNSTEATTRVRNPYSDYGYYFLTESDDEPATLSQDDFVASFYPSTEYTHWIYEDDSYAWFRGGRRLFDGTAITASKPQTIVLPANPNATQATLTVIVSAGATAQVRIELGDSLLSSSTISVSGDYVKGADTSGYFRIYDTQQSDTLRLSLVSGTEARLDYVQLAWDEPLDQPDLTVSRPTPEYVCHITNQNHHADTAVDMVIIIPTSQKLLTQATRLKTFHEQNDSLRVRIVPADELFNEFSSGTPDANAYRRYLKMLYDRAKSEADMPSYLLLFGDCMWDNRMNTTECSGLDPDDYLLCFESDNSFSKILCYVDDGWFCLLDEGEGTNVRTNDKLDVAVGRFPVTTSSDAKTMVDKVIRYTEDPQAGDWQNTLVFMGDDGDSNQHMKDIDAAAEEAASLYPEFLIKKIMWDSYTREGSSTGYTYPEVTKLIKKYQRSGALLMDYGGHGREDQISHEKVLKLQDFKDFTNTNLPLWVTASCDIMPFDGPIETIGETAVLNANGGAIAFFGTTRTVYAFYNRPINTAFVRNVLSIDSLGKPMAIGEAARRAKNEMIETSSDLTQNKLQYSLLGDPALRLCRPTVQITIDSINGKALGEASDINLAAGTLATVSGHFNSTEPIDGTVTMTVRDNRQLITCLLNDKSEAEEAFQYYDRPTTLYTGTDSIRQNLFRITFAVPKDINYSNAEGMINLYGVDANNVRYTGHGYTTDFTVGGSDLADNDSIAPSVYCYLNSPDFTNGDTVNPTPYFVAEISDNDGINASGAGIGHDMQLVIDGDPSLSYSLNDNFSYDFGSYTSGTTFYSIPELEEGSHSLKFYVWDIQNNRSVSQLNFKVSKRLQPDIVSVACSNNPATESTTFIIQHNRAGSTVDMILDIFDMSGRQLWQHTEQTTSDTQTLTYTWNLTTDSGQRMQTGVYLYRIRLASDGSTYTSKAKKLVIIGNK